MSNAVDATTPEQPAPVPAGRGWSGRRWAGRGWTARGWTARGWTGRGGRQQRPTRLPAVAVLAVLAAGVVLRLVWVGPLWLDEAQSVAISRLPLGALFHALRQDGSPPLYYLLLHVWMAAFGTSTVAVRALSSVFALASLPVGYLAARRFAGRRVALLALLVLAANPFAVRYATETRMYALELLLVLVGALVVPRAWERPTLARLWPVTVLTALLAYTHYWAFYVIATMAVVLVVRRRWRVLAAMAVSAVAFLPWLPSFLYQARYTGTPWAIPADPSALVATVLQWGGPGWLGQLLGVLLLVLAVLGLLARPGRGVRGETGTGAAAPIVLTGSPVGRWAGLFYAGPLAIAVLAALVVTSGYAVRYTSVVLGAFVLLVGLGLAVLPGRWQWGMTAVVVVASLIGAVGAVSAPRTQAGAVAAALKAQSRPGDVLAVCPDQLGPALARLLPASLRLRESAFADPAGPVRVDWVDYAQRMRFDSPAAYARRLLAQRPPGGTIWLVLEPGYRTLGTDCEQIAGYLGDDLGPGVSVVEARTSGEPESLLAFAAAPS